MSNLTVEPTEQPLTGTCHCGAVSWRFTAELKQATACNCTVCRKYGVLWIYGTEGKTVFSSGETKAYIRKDGESLEFHHCETCGCTISWRLVTPTDEGKTISAVNLRLVDDPELIMDLPVRHFDGLDTFKEAPGDAKTVRDIWF